MYNIHNYKMSLKEFIKEVERDLKGIKEPAVKNGEIYTIEYNEPVEISKKVLDKAEAIRNKRQAKANKETEDLLEKSRLLIERLDKLPRNQRNKPKKTTIKRQIKKNATKKAQASKRRAQRRQKEEGCIIC